MSDKYTLLHEGLSQWINSPNNGGECCQTWADTVDELNRLLARIKRLEEAGDAIIWVFCKASVSIRNDRESEALKLWIKARGVKL